MPPSFSPTRSSGSVRRYSTASGELLACHAAVPGFVAGGPDGAALPPPQASASADSRLSVSEPAIAASLRAGGAVTMTETGALHIWTDS